MPIRRNPLENVAHVSFYFISIAQHILHVLLGWLSRWEVSGRTTARCCFVVQLYSNSDTATNRKNSQSEQFKLMRNLYPSFIWLRFTMVMPRLILYYHSCENSVLLLHSHNDINHNDNTRHIQTQIQANSVVSDTNGFINSWLWFIATRGERHNS